MLLPIRWTVRPAVMIAITINDTSAKRHYTTLFRKSPASAKRLGSTSHCLGGCFRTSRTPVMLEVNTFTDCCHLAIRPSDGGLYHQCIHPVAAEVVVRAATKT